MTPIIAYALLRIGAVLPTGEEKPVAFVSRTLSPSEKNCTQMKRLLPRYVICAESSHSRRPYRPLTTISLLAVARHQRWTSLNFE